uniref:Major facilitator superfamily (MFS) profile domain-containing protein n=1 Tax=Wuchereria bancrofti TaxID=6293 RepID=A0A1I8ECU9_WUCBA
MPTEKSIKAVNGAWLTEGTQGDTGRDLPPVVSGNHSSSKLLHAEDNSKRNGHANPDEAEACNGENMGGKCNHDNAQDCYSDKDGSEEGDFSDVLPTPPDGGYGWVIVFAAFMSNFVVDGIANSFGAFMSIYQDYFNASKALVSLIGSLLIGCYLLIGSAIHRSKLIQGPVAGGLVNKYGARMVVIIGSFVAGLSFLASIFCSSIYVFMIFYGFLGGAGFGLIYLPSIVTVGYYFEKKRSIATGIAVAGSGVGTFVLPPLCIVLINQFGWKIAICSLAALSFSSTIYGLLYRPLQAPAIKRGKENTKTDAEELLLESKGKEWKTNDEESKDSAADENILQKFRHVHNTQSESETHQFDETTLLTPAAENMTGKNSGTHSDSSERLSAKTRRDPETRFMIRESINNKTASATDLKTSHGNLANVLNRISVLSFAHSMNLLSQSSQMKGAESLISVASSIKEFNRPINRRDIFYSGSIRNLPEFKSEGVVITSHIESHKSRSLHQSLRCECIPVRIRNVLSEMIDISLLKEPAMFLLCISNLCGMLGFYVPFMFLIDMAVAKGHTKASGRIAFGWLADRGWLSALTINNFSLLGCGVLTCLCPLFPGYGAAYISLTSIVLVDELGLDRLTNSFGLLVVSRGIASLLGTPLAGIVYDMFASYDASFYFAGVIILLSGLVSCLIPAIHRCRHNELAKETVEEARMIDEEIQSGKLSVFMEYSERNLMGYQCTVQSLPQQQKLFGDSRVIPFGKTADSG